MTEKKQHGGHRKGAGRKPLYKQPMVQTTVFLPRRYVDRLRELGDGNLSAGIRSLIEKHLSS